MKFDVLIIHKLWCPLDFENVLSFFNPRQNTTSGNEINMFNFVKAISF